MFRTIALVGLSFCVAGGVFADGPPFPRPPERRIDLTEHIGKTFLQTLLSPVVGIDAEIDAEIYEPVTIIPGARMISLLGELQPVVATRLYRDFKDGQAGVLQAVAAVEGQTVMPGAFRESLRPVTAPLAVDAELAGRANGALAGLALLLSGSGTLVLVDDANYFYNVGYQDDNVSTGRSYAASGGRLLLDPSHRDYLRILHALLKSTDEDAAFYRSVMELLTATDSRRVSTLTADGQVVFVDFVSVYTAELERHEMAGLGLRAPWGIDYAEVTLVADYGAASGMVMEDGAFVAGTAQAYAAKSSIGNVRGEFGRLSRLITAYLRQPEHSPRLVDRLVDLTPIEDGSLAASVEGNIFRRVLTYLNIRSSAPEAQRNADEIADAMVDLLDAVRADHAAITAFIKNCMDDPDGSFACGAAEPPAGVPL